MKEERKMIKDSPSNISREKNILFLSNGYGEDAIATSIVENLLKKNPFLKIKAFPLVGEGKSYSSFPVEVFSSHIKLPSEGFIRNRPLYLLKDIKAGLFKKILTYTFNLYKEAKRGRLTVVVGDTFLLFLAGLSVRSPIVFLSTSKSNYKRGHLAIERYLMKKFCQLVLARDKLTAESLKKVGIKAMYMGNIMMDCLKITGEDFGLSPKDKVVGILPGSRREAYTNIKVILQSIEIINKKSPLPVKYLLAISPSLNITNLGEAIVSQGWKITDSSDKDKKRGIIAYLSHFNNLKIPVISGKFGDVLNKSQVIIGLSGTGNEQAAGMGKPVVAFPGKGPQITKRFLELQSKMLGGAVIVKPKDPFQIAEELIDLLNNPLRREKIGKIGKNRMGPPGGSEKVASFLIEEFNLY